MASNNRLITPPDFNYQVKPRYPKQPPYNENCQVNQRYKTVPQYPFQNPPWITSLAQEYVEDRGLPTVEYGFQTNGPASLKHLYNGPHDYQVQARAVPKGTMYEMDYSEFGYGGKREVYHYKVYPFTHRHARELNYYNGYTLPYPNITGWTQYKAATP